MVDKAEIPTPPPYFDLVAAIKRDPLAWKVFLHSLKRVLHG